MGFGVQIPHPRGIQKLIPHPHGGGNPIPHGGRGWGPNPSRQMVPLFSAVPAEFEVVRLGSKNRIEYLQAT